MAHRHRPKLVFCGLRHLPPPRTSIEPKGSAALQFSDSLFWFPRHHLADHPEVAQTSQDKGVNSPQSESTVRLQVAVAVLSGGFVKGEIQAAISVGGRRSP